MKQYVINDCAAVAESFFHMYPEKTDNHQIPQTSPTTSTNIGMNLDDDLSNISEDELIEILRPKFNKKFFISYTQQQNKTTSTKQTTIENK
ncbi:unnamed protein product [Rotaria sordida]|uniref:Uncharacterized protein n=1 Tax=Rotaria sordida TaxID=392033 RepID=A0A814J9V9_9BILA|nr:unnamed protein product [Rotaria sordida]